MTTYNVTPSQTAVPASGAAQNDGRMPFMAETIVDFNSGIVTQPSGSTTLSGTSGTVIDAINVPAGFQVQSTGLEVVLADTAGNSGTLQVKVGSATQGSAVTVASLGFVATGGTVTPVVPAGSNQFVTLTVGTGTINAVVRVYAWLVDCRAKALSGVAIGTQTNPSGQATGTYANAYLKYTGTNALTVVA